MSAFFQSLIRFLLASFLIIGGALPALGQLRQGTQKPPAPLWDANFYGAPTLYGTADAACRAQHEHFNPNATYRPTTYSDVDTRDCHWDRNEQSNTILPAWVDARCPEPYVFRAPGACMLPNNKVSRYRGACEPGGNGPLSSPDIKRGNPVSLSHGAKVETELDYSDARGRLNVERHYFSLEEDRSYNPAPTALPGFGARWHGVIPGRLLIFGDQARQGVYMSERCANGLFIAPYDPAVFLWNDGDRPDERRRLSAIGTRSGTRPTFYSEVLAATPGAELRLTYANGANEILRKASAYFAMAELDRH